MDNSDNKYLKAKTERQNHIDDILNSESRNKIVVAGPGTGKTYLFKEILKNKKKSLTLTFVNALVEDLSLDLYGLSDVKTLHGFARGILGRTKEDESKNKIKIFPKLSQIIKEDAKILLNEEIDFDSIFHNLDDKDEEIKFYKTRKDYYGKYYGYSDIIYAIVRFFENKTGQIPEYEQVVVDEFQDFNKLEVALIELLSQKSPMLLAGDDDQALYSFKNAKADHIREKHSDLNTDYASFTLPYCSRCTEVIVDATNDILESATKNGNLDKRISKTFQYFEDETKDKESARYPKIAYSQQYAKQIPWFINKQIEKIAEEVKSKFSVLIISPTKTQSRLTVMGLKNKGFTNIDYVEKKDEKEASLIDGLKLLLNNKKCNLGWRIIAKHILTNKEFEKIITSTKDNEAKNIFSFINKTKIEEINNIIKILKSIKEDANDFDENEFINILPKLGFNCAEIMKNIVKDEIASDPHIGNPGIRKIPIKATTIQSSKGLASDYVFITYFDDQYFINDKDKNKISDQDICNFLVALTRARKKIFLISSCKKEPIFLNWINNSRIEKL